MLVSQANDRPSHMSPTQGKTPGLPLLCLKHHDVRRLGWYLSLAHTTVRVSEYLQPNTKNIFVERWVWPTMGVEGVSMGYGLAPLE